MRPCCIRNPTAPLPVTTRCPPVARARQQGRQGRAHRQPVYMANFLSRLFGGGTSAPAKAEVRRAQAAGRLLYLRSVTYTLQYNQYQYRQHTVCPSRGLVMLLAACPHENGRRHQKGCTYVMLMHLHLVHKAGLPSTLGPLAAHALQESSGSILSWARAAKPACELAPKAAPEGLELATFAGGCFWGLELAYQASSRACSLLTAGPQSCVCSELVHRESGTGPSSAVSSRLLRLCHRLCRLPRRPACESRLRDCLLPAPSEAGQEAEDPAQASPRSSSPAPPGRSSFKQ